MMKSDVLAIVGEKKRLRRKTGRIVVEMGLDKRRAMDEVICGRVLGLDEVNAANVVCCYVAKDDEVETKGIIEGLWKMGKKVVVPRIKMKNEERVNDLEMVEITSWEDVESGVYGILEPKRAGSKSNTGSKSSVGKNEVEVFVVPGRVFDKKGNRLGRGGGYYDRLLADVKATKIGVCYSCQKVDKLVQMAHDVGMDRFISD